MTQATPNGDLTMADLARMAGVSESTVSRALAGSPLVAEKTRLRIVELAKAASYTVNESARNFRQKKARTIEVVIPLESHHRARISDPFFLDLIGALSDALPRRRHDMLLSTVPPWSTGERSNPLISGRADGVVVVGQGRNRSNLRAFARANPRVVVWGGQVDDDYAVVGSDNRLGGRLATDHLLAIGRRRIAFMGDVALPEIKLRHDGYVEALVEAGAAADPALTINAPFDFQDANAFADRFVAGGARFDAVVAASDVIAVGAILALRNRGVSVPGDVSIVGYDDIHSAAWYSPPLTTVSQFIHRGGEALVDALFDIIDGAPPTSRTLRPELIVRQSCGGAAGR
ncbi:MAG: LacI family DNA-binding transcriptional regulator [Parvularculaceae bacterium]